MRSANAMRSPGQGGFTLVELLVALTLSGVLLAAALAALTSISRDSRDITDRAATQQRVQAELERIVREVGQASTATVTNAQTLQLTTFVNIGGSTTKVKRTVTYACGATSCTRTVAGGSAGVAIAGKTNSDVFSVSGSFVAVKVAVALQGGDSATFTDGASPRNLA